MIKLSILLLAASAVAASAAPMELPPHPRLLFTREGVAKLKDRIQRCDWAKARWGSIEREADGLLGSTVELPPRGGNWFHWYACPTHGAGLKPGKKIGAWKWEHVCPVGHEVLKSDPSKPSTDYDGCAISNVHSALARDVLYLGVAYQVTGEAKYARKAREILLAYADRYPNYPLHNIHGEPKLGGGRVGPQTLDEAVWLIPICQGADLVWDTLSDDDRKAISDKLLLPAVREVILPHRLGVHNIQCWKNSAVGLVGFLLGDQELIHEALYDADRGFARQMSQGVMADGGWWEGAWGYHFYTVSALWPLAEAASNCGIDLYGEKLKSMFDAPLRFAAPSFTLPAFNDSGEVNLKASAGIYELAYARFSDPRYLELLSKVERKSDYALWFGVPELPSPPEDEWKSRNYPRSGYAILARGKGDSATWLCLKYGPHGGGHGHLDKLNCVIYSGGRIVGIDPGTARYGLPIQAEWYRATLAHNTLTVDETSQEQAEGKCIDFGSANGVDYAVADAGPIYDGVKFTRTVLLPDAKLVVFIDHIACDTERTLDVAYHHRGEWGKLPDGAAWTPPDKPGYKHLKDATIRSTDSSIDLPLASPSAAISLLGGEPTEVITAAGVGDNAGDRVPVVIFRRKAKETTFVWCVSLDGKRVDRDRLEGLALLLAPTTGWTKEAKPVSLGLSNRYLSLGFDRATGGWVSLKDRVTGDELLTGPAEQGIVPHPRRAELDTEKMKRAADAGSAVSIEGDWQFARATSDAKEASEFLAGRFERGEWTSTPIPSVLGKGDNRLHNQVGDFWYRREFACPSGWTGDLALVMGAVDDTDLAYFNGALIGSTGMDTPEWWKAPRLYRIPAKLVRRDGPNVILVKVTNGGFDGGISGPVVIGLASALLPDTPDAPPLESSSTTRERGASLVRMAAQSGALLYEVEYRLFDDKPLIARRYTLTNTGDKPVDLSGFTVSIPPVALGTGQSVVFPGSLPVGDTPLSGLSEGQRLTPRCTDPLAVLWDQGSKRGVGAWYHCEDEWSPVSVVRAGQGAAIHHTQSIACVLKPGERVTLGTQYVWLVHGSREAAIGGVQQVYKLIGLAAPSRGLSGLGSKVIYCGHPGGTTEMNFRGYGGFKAMDAYVPTLRKMGISLLWLLPIWEHGDGRGWNLYGPSDHFQVSPLYGTPGDLKRLSADCARGGIGLVFDLVPHGPPDDSQLAKDHPEWVCRDRDGKMHYEWGQLSFDYAIPAWQDYMRRAAEHDAREYGAVGARVDCGSGSPANWNVGSGRRPSESGLGGGLRMTEAIREGFLRVRKSALAMPEEYSAANVFYRVSDLTYDSQLFLLLLDLHDRQASPQEWTTSLTTFLHDQSLALPPGALKMRFVSNHDTVAGTFFKSSRPMKMYGPAKARALLALCALVPGVPMLYQGDEDPSIYGAQGESNVDFLSRIYHLRKTTPALAQGRADYTSAKATNGILACTRDYKGQKALVLISLNPDEVQTTVTGPTGNWRDLLSGETFTAGKGFTLPMGAFQVRVLTRTEGETRE